MADTLIDNIGLLPIEIGHSVPEYPFTTQGDYDTLVITRSYRQLAVAYRPGQRGIMRDTRPSNAEADVVYYPDAYLVDETKAGPTGFAGIVEFSRTFARIPPTLYDPLTRLYDRPVLHDIKSGSTYAVSFDDGATSHLFTSRVSVSSIGSITQPTTVIDEAAEVGTDFTSGSFTAYSSNYIGVTISLTSTAQTIQYLLTYSLGATNVSVTKAVGTITIAWDSGIAIIDCSATDVVIDGSAASGSVTLRRLRAAQSSAEIRTTGTPTATRAVTTGSAHSGSAGEWIAMWNGDKLVTMCKSVSASGSSITVPADEGPLATGGVAITHIAFASTAGYRVANRGVDASCRLARRFYLPGVTSGVTTLADIPNFTPKTDPIAWLGVVASYLAAPSASTYAVIETQSLSRWLNGPIVEKAVVEIQMADAVVTSSVSA